MSAKKLFIARGRNIKIRYNRFLLKFRIIVLLYRIIKKFPMVHKQKKSIIVQHLAIYY